MKAALFLSALASASSSLTDCTWTNSADQVLDFGPIRDAGAFDGADSQGNHFAFHMCARTSGPDCTAAGFDALVIQTGAWGCAIVGDWDPVNSPPTWSEQPGGVTMSLQNGDACPDGTARGLAVDFECTPGAVGPVTFTVTEPVTCQYAWTFATTAACAGVGPPTPGPAPAPAPGAWTPAEIAARNFGCGHISCGWMLLILLPLVTLLAFAVLLVVNKTAGKADTWLDAVPGTVVGPALFGYFVWGLKFALFNWPCCAQKFVFKRFNLATPRGGFAESDYGDANGAEDSANGSYQAQRSPNASFDDL